MMQQEKKTRQTKTSEPLARRVGPLIHIVAWAIPLFTPFFFSVRNEEAIPTHFLLGSTIIILSFIVVFYTNYIFLIKRFLSTMKISRFVISNLLLIFVITLLVHILMQQIPHPDKIGEEIIRQHSVLDAIGFIFRNLFMYSIIIALSMSIRMTENWFKTETIRKDFERSQAEAELKNLKSQLNPHFLFNTLNNIYSLIALSPEQAQEAVHDLSHLLRYVMYESSQATVTLRKELDFIQNYIELMRIRLAKNVELKKDIDIRNQEIQIAPLLFISLIENAFKHGVSNNKPSFLNIRITEKDGTLDCIIENSFFPKDDQDKSGSGIGIPNLKKRLALLYPEMHELHYGREGDVYRSSLSIKLSAL